VGGKQEGKNDRCVMQKRSEMIKGKKGKPFFLRIKEKKEGGKSGGSGSKLQKGKRT